jgi:hypothetical protein
MPAGIKRVLVGEKNEKERFVYGDVANGSGLRIYVGGLWQ